MGCSEPGEPFGGSSVSRMPKHAVLDEFLPAGLHDALLAHALASEHRFLPAEVAGRGQQGYDAQSRVAWYCADGLGHLKSAFREAVAARLDDLFDRLGMAPFPVARTELELAAHRDGSYFQPHIDTMTQDRRSMTETDRVVTMVYYFHASPRRFSGGDLLLYPFDRSAPKAIAPADNRLLAFPAICLHEVTPVIAPADFDAARFAVNCWLHRAR